jgi:uncharacterized phiE125 gp8 family phage protein
MTINEMRALVGLGDDATDAEVVAAYAALTDDGFPTSIEIVEPVSVELARKQCRLDDDYEDDLILSKISAAREWVEDYTERVLAQRTMVAHFNAWGKFLELTRRPITSVDAIIYTGSEGGASYDSGAYALGAVPLRIYPGGAAFPTLRTGGGVMVAYTAGFDVGEVPRKYIEAILVLTGAFVANREGGHDDAFASAKALLKLDRKPGMA